MEINHVIKRIPFNPLSVKYVRILENTGQRKLVFRHLLCSDCTDIHSLITFIKASNEPGDLFFCMY